MLLDENRDVLERELDLVQRIFEAQFGREAAREAFARRASALGEGAPDPGMAAHEIVTPLEKPKLELPTVAPERFKRRADKKESAMVFAARVYAPWNGTITMRDSGI